MYLSKKKPAERTSLSSSSARNEISAKRNEEKRLRDLELDTIKSLKNICQRLESKEYLTLASPFSYRIDESKIVFYGIDYDTFTKPYIKYSFVIFDDLTFKLWHEDVTLDARNYLHIVETNKLSYFSQVERFLELLPNLNCPAISINDEINNCVQKRDNLAKNVDELIQPKLQFIIEQLKLALCTSSIVVILRIYCQCVCCGRTPLLLCINKFAMKVCLPFPRLGISKS